MCSVVLISVSLLMKLAILANQTEVAYTLLYLPAI